MARAIAKCRCEHCGQEFEKIAFKNNREQAESWREWAEENFTECPECYAKRVAAEKAKKATEIIAKYEIPEIKGVSEKQIKFANDLRNKYVSEHESEIKRCKSLLKKASEESFKQKCEAAGVDLKTAINQNLKRYRFEVAAVILAENNASKIIDELR